jgi:hypothetical protein
LLNDGIAFLPSWFALGRRFLFRSAIELRPFEQIRRFETEPGGKPVDNVDAGRVHTAFDRADIRAIDLRPMRKLFLRNAVRSPVFPQVEGHDLSNVHDSKRSGL